jgi:hypothetical protein
MAHDIFEKLAKTEVPPEPPRLDAQFQQRLNKVLLMTHLVDFTLHALPRTAVGLLSSVMHLVALTLTGKGTEPPKPGEPTQP